MPLPVKEGDLTVGHCWSPTPALKVDSAAQVFMDGRQPITTADTYLVHPITCGILPTHIPSPVVGSENVYINGAQVVRDGDPLNCGDIANATPGTVFINGGGGGDRGAVEGEFDTAGFFVDPPTISYPSNITVTYEVNAVRDPFGNISHVFGRGCVVGSVRPTLAYSNMTQENTGRTFRNYPGRPLSEIVGAPDLPLGAQEFYRQPIAISDFVVDFGNNNLSQTLVPGVTINPATGVISGSLTSFPGREEELRSGTSYTFRVKAKNRIGYPFSTGDGFRGSIVNINVNLSPGRC